MTEEVAKIGTDCWNKYAHDDAVDVDDDYAEISGDDVVLIGNADSDNDECLIGLAEQMIHRRFVVFQSDDHFDIRLSHVLRRNDVVSDSRGKIVVLIGSNRCAVDWLGDL